MRAVNWKLIGLLSLFGLFMGIGTVFFIPPNLEPFCWLVIFVICAVVLAQRAPSKAPLHAFLVSLANCVWITGAHIIFVDTYLAEHLDEAKMNAQTGLSPRVAMLLVGPAIGVMSGGVLALFTWAATRVLQRITPSNR